MVYYYYSSRIVTLLVGETPIGTNAGYRMKICAQGTQNKVGTCKVERTPTLLKFFENV